MTYLFEKYELDAERFSLTRQGKRVSLEPKAMRVLLFLVRNQRKLLEKNTIIQAVWPDTFVEDSTLSRSIALIRKQLADDPRSPTFIETVPTLGYRFIATVETAASLSKADSVVPLLVKGGPLPCPQGPGKNGSTSLVQFSP